VFLGVFGQNSVRPCCQAESAFFWHRRGLRHDRIFSRLIDSSNAASTDFRERFVIPDLIRNLYKKNFHHFKFQISNCKLSTFSQNRA
jgi:hypothetical protein